MIFLLRRTSMCTTRSDMVLASLFSSIILSNPSALDPRLSTGFRAVELLESDDECPEPSRLGVGVAKRLELFIEPPVAGGVEATALLLLMGGLALPAADADADFLMPRDYYFVMVDSSSI